MKPAPQKRPSPESIQVDPPPEFRVLDVQGRAVLNPVEAARKLACHVDHIYDLIDEGLLRAVDISGRNNLTNRRCFRIPIESWRAFIKRQTL